MSAGTLAFDRLEEISQMVRLHEWKELEQFLLRIVQAESLRFLAGRWSRATLSGWGPVLHDDVPTTKFRIRCDDVPRHEAIALAAVHAFNRLLGVHAVEC